MLCHALSGDNFSSLFLKSSMYFLFQEDFYRFTLFYLSYALIIVQTVLASIAESLPYEPLYGDRKVKFDLFTHFYCWHGSVISKPFFQTIPSAHQGDTIAQLIGYCTAVDFQISSLNSSVTCVYIWCFIPWTYILNVTPTKQTLLTNQPTQCPAHYHKRLLFIVLVWIEYIYLQNGAHF